MGSKSRRRKRGAGGAGATETALPPVCVPREGALEALAERLRRSGAQSAMVVDMKGEPTGVMVRLVGRSPEEEALQTEDTRRAVGLGQARPMEPIEASRERPACAPPAAVGADPLPGSLAGPWRLVERIGEGGMGVVYRASHAETSRPAAVKVLRPSLREEAELVARFHWEARAADLVRHPNVVRVLDHGRLGEGTPWYAMELLEGVSLGQVLKAEGRLMPRRAIRIARLLALGLEAAHRAGVIHRDLKPGNVMLVRDGIEHERVKILDFGIAKLPDVEIGPATMVVTGADARLGTPYYMSPEQILGGKVDGRTDVYAFGVLLYQMLSGLVPFDEPAEDAMRRHLTERAPTLRQAGIEVPAVLETLVARCLRKAREARPDADELPAALDAAEAELDVASAVARATLAGATPAAAPADLGGRRGSVLPAWVAGAVFCGALVLGSGLGRLLAPRGGTGVAMECATGTAVVAVAVAAEPKASASATADTASPADALAAAPAPTAAPAPAPVPPATAAWGVAAVDAVSGGVPVPAPEDTVRLEIDSRPQGALVFLDGASTGRRTPATIDLARSEIPRDVLLRLGRREYRTMVTPAASLRVSVALERPPRRTRPGALGAHLP